MVSTLALDIKNQNLIKSSDFVDYGLAHYDRASHNYNQAPWLLVNKKKDLCDFAYYRLEIRASPSRAASIIEMLPFFGRLYSPASSVET